MLIGSSHLGTMTQQSIAWDITSALYSNKSFNFNSVDSQGKSIRFDPTGKIMFLAGAGADKVYEFALSVAWDISTAVYSSKFLSVAGETTLMEAMEVSADGTKVYAADKGGVVYQYTLTSAWDISTASYSSKSLDTSGRTTTIKGCTISSDGTKFYVCDPFTNDVDQYNLSTPYDLSTGSYASKTVDLDSEDAVIQGVFLGNTDATLFVSGDTANAIFQYTLSTPGDISTAVYNSISLDVSAETTSPRNVTFSEDGTIMYVVSSSPDTIFQYTL